MTAVAAKPVVLVPACNRLLGHHPFHIAGKKYIDAVRLARCQPLVVPSATADELDALLDLADGLLLTGSPSNVHPSHFDEGVHDPAWMSPFIFFPDCMRRMIPIFPGRPKLLCGWVSLPSSSVLCGCR